MNEEESIIGFDALYKSMLKCRHGVLWKNSAAHYYLHGIEETIKLESQLKGGTYKAKPPKKFIITHNKKREAVSITFRDRVYQRSLNDNMLYPTMTKSFVYSNMACQKGKGTNLARETLSEYIRKAFRKYGYDCYVLQCDIHGYYPNMQHSVAEMTFKEKLPQAAYDMTEKILRSQYEGDIGYNPGSQMIQIAGISVLDKLDHYVKEQLHIKFYMRYMDDFVLIHHNEAYLNLCKRKVSEKLAEIGFELNEKKTKVYQMKAGIKMLGFTFKILPSGKLLKLIDPHNVKMERRKLKKLVKLAKENEITKEKVDQCYESWKAHARYGNSFKLLQRMDKYYKELWQNDYQQIKNPNPPGESNGGRNGKNREGIC